MDKFWLLEKIGEFNTLFDKTNAPFNILVAPSQNVLINDADKISTRKGYTIYGAANTATTPIEGSFEWNHSSGSEIDIRSYDDELEVYVGTFNSNVFNSWEKLNDGYTAVDFIFDAWWNSTEGIDLLLFVNGTSNMYEWSGGITTFASLTSTTITKQGTGTWAASRFLIAGTRQFRIKDSGGTWRTGSYTGGETTTTLTGVTDLTTYTFTAGALILQEVRTNANTPASGFNSDIIRVLNNQVWAGSNTSMAVRVSKDTDFLAYTFSTPRVAGEGATLTLDNAPKAFAIQNKNMYISAGRNDWYKPQFEQLDVGGSIKETLKIKKLTTGKDMAAQSQRLVVEAGDYIAFISYEPTLRILGNLENLQEPGQKTFSNPIKPDFDDADFTNGNLIWSKNRILVSRPNDGIVNILETREKADGTTRRFWQPPQILPIRQFAIISGELYGHSSGLPETYKLFDGTNDNEKGFKAIVAFAYRSYKERSKLKNFTKWMTEGYISSNSKLLLTLNYNFGGFTQRLETEIAGDNDAILFEIYGSGSLGDNPLGDSPFGDQPDVSSQQPKFKVINEFPRQDFFEIQAVYETDAIDAQWEILAHGGNVEFSTNKPINIIQ